MIRPANLSDLNALVQLETRNFDSDRLTRRSFHYLLTHANASLLVDDKHAQLRGYALLRFHAGSTRARLYSLAVDRKHRKRGIGHALLKAAENRARAHGATCVRLELRRSNRAAIHLYEKAGYRVFGRYLDYYADHMDALRMEKQLAVRRVRASARPAAAARRRL